MIDAETGCTMEEMGGEISVEAQERILGAKSVGEVRRIAREEISATA